MRKRSLAAMAGVLGVASMFMVISPSWARPPGWTENPTPESIFSWCAGAREIQGKAGEGYQNGPWPNFTGDSCTFEETSFTQVTGDTVKASQDVENCPPKTVKNLKLKVDSTATVAQYNGEYDVTEIGGGGGLFGALNGQWLKHEGTMDLTIKSLGATDGSEWEVPEGKVMHIEFTPIINVMKGNWHFYDDGSPTPTPWDKAEKTSVFLEHEVRGPKKLPGGGSDGTFKPVTQPC